MLSSITAHGPLWLAVTSNNVRLMASVRQPENTRWYPRRLTRRSKRSHSQRLPRCKREGGCSEAGTCNLRLSSASWLHKYCDCEVYLAALIVLNSVPPPSRTVG